MVWRRFAFGVLVRGRQLLRLLLVRLSSCLVGINLIVLCMALGIGCLSLWFCSLLFSWFSVVLGLWVDVLGLVADLGLFIL